MTARNPFLKEVLMYHELPSLPIVALALLSCAAASMASGTTIVVDTGPYPSAEVAGHDEACVDWSDAASPGGRASTECFAALELQTYLRKLTGRTSDFAIAKDSPAPSGDLIVIGGLVPNALSRRLCRNWTLRQNKLPQWGPRVTASGLGQWTAATFG